MTEQHTSAAAMSDSASSAGEPMRFAVIGCGALARQAHIPNIVESPKTALQVCCDLSEEALAACQAFGPVRTSSDFHEVIDDPQVEAICLAATEKLRLPVIEAAAKAGKPVYVEKPLARTLEEMYRIQELVHEAGIPFCVGHNRRNAPCMIEAHRIFRQHMAGPADTPSRLKRKEDPKPEMSADGVAGMSVRINDDWYSWKNWVFDKEQAPHGPMLFEMTHFTDLCNWFLAARPKAAMAMEHGMFNHVVGIEYETGEMASIAMFANGTFGYPKELYEMFGNGGAVIVDQLVELRTAGIAEAPPRKPFPMLDDRYPEVGREGGFYGWLAKHAKAHEKAMAEDDFFAHLCCHADMGHAHALNRFVDQIRGQGPEVCGVDDAVLATRVAFAAIESARKRREVEVAEI